MSYVAFRVPNKGALPPGSPHTDPIFWGVTLPAVERFSHYKRKQSELWLMHNPEPYVEVYLNN
jgi:hypothetical protein